MTSKESELIQKTLGIISEDLQTIRLHLQKIEQTQDYQALDIEKHIKRTDLLQNHLERVEREQISCPARLNTRINKTLIEWAKDATILIGLVILIKTFGVIS
jgi:hypothetical protein